MALAGEGPLQEKEGAQVMGGRAMAVEVGAPSEEEEALGQGQVLEEALAVVGPRLGVATAPEALGRALAVDQAGEGPFLKEVEAQVMVDRALAVEVGAPSVEEEALALGQDLVVALEVVVRHLGVATALEALVRAQAVGDAVLTVVG